MRSLCLAWLLLLLAWGPVRAERTRFTIIDQGSGGSDIILIPGLASSRRVWSAEASKLAAHHRCHLVQIDGFGGQPAGPNATGTGLLPAIVAELHGYIAKTGQHPVVIGHSVGGLLALKLAQQHPADVSKVVVVDSLPFYGLVATGFNPNATVASVTGPAQHVRDHILTSSPGDYAKDQKVYARTLATSNATGVAKVLADGQASDRRVVAEVWFEDATTDLRPMLHAIAAPTLVLSAYTGPKQYQATLLALYQQAYRGLPKLKLVQIAPSRHFIMYDQPGQLDKEVQAFMGSR